MLRLAYTVNLVKTKDYTYVKMQGVMWAFAEIAFGLACSCFPILPRLYQHVSGITPYSGGTADEGLQDRSTKASTSAAAKQGAHWGSKNKEKGGNWIHLDDRNIGGLPPRTTVEVEQRTVDEDAVEDAVEGKGVGLADNDLEKGQGRTHRGG